MGGAEGKSEVMVDLKRPTCPHCDRTMVPVWIRGHRYMDCVCAESQDDLAPADRPRCGLCSAEMERRRVEDRWLWCCRVHVTANSTVKPRFAPREDPADLHLIHPTAHGGFARNPWTPDKPWEDPWES